MEIITPSIFPNGFLNMTGVIGIMKEGVLPDYKQGNILNLMSSLSSGLGLESAYAPLLELSLPLLCG